MKHASVYPWEIDYEDNDDDNKSWYKIWQHVKQVKL